MDQRTKPTPRLAPLPPEHSPELKEAFDVYRKTLGFVPNSVLIMQRKPKMVKALAHLAAAIWEPDGKVDRGLKRLIAHVASRTSGCPYCMAHTAGGALVLGVDEKKVEAVWDYQTSPLYSAAERAALDVAVAAAQVPNAVTDEMFLTLHKHWTDEQIVEIIGTISVFGFLNRWNDTMATPLEDEPIEVGEKLLASHGWSVGKHAR
ncbi:MAG: carboxymuconolactone decarboxylase family protein [Rhizobiales bacterium]|nr:carboxymuconolactone decarboxylase family protein [Hyphomicrobiales bacterium]